MEKKKEKPKDAPPQNKTDIDPPPITRPSGSAKDKKPTRIGKINI